MCVYLSIGNMAKYLCNTYAVFHHVAQVLLYNADMVKKKINTPVDAPLPETVKVFKNGALYDTETKRIIGVRPELATGETTQITSSNAAEYQARAVVNKRLVMMQAANAEVSPELVAQYGAYAHVAERAQTLQRIASSPEAGKAAVMAHDALVRDTGMSEKQQEQTQQAALSLTDQALLGLIQAITDRVKGDVIDTE